MTTINEVCNETVPHIAENIFQNLDTVSLSRCRMVCKGWKDTIDKNQKLKHKLRIGILKKKAILRKSIFHPDYLAMVDNIMATSVEETIEKLMKIIIKFFSEPIHKKPPKNDHHILGYWSLDLRDTSFIQLVFSDIKRLKFFFPYLPHKNPTVSRTAFVQRTMTALHFVSYMGWHESVNFMMDNLKVKVPVSTDEYRLTPYDIATKEVKNLISQKLQQSTL